MRLFPEMYIRPTGSRLSVSSVGKLKEDLTDWIPINNLTSVKDNTEPDYQKMADGTEITTAEKILLEMSNISLIKGDLAAVDSIIGDLTDLCFVDYDMMIAVILYGTKVSRKKTAESGSSVTVTLTAEKLCTDASKVSKEISLADAYVIGIVTDSETLNPVSGAMVTCVSPLKPGYSVITDSHGEFRLEMPVDDDNISRIRVSKGETKDIELQAYQGEIINLEVVL